MGDQFRIDSHKLMFHPERVAAWKKSYGVWQLEKEIYPIYVEVSPTNVCNHNCTFCGLDFAHGKQKLNYKALERFFVNMAGNVRSIMFAGEGEPLLYKDLGKALVYCNNIGIDTSLTTNLVPLTDSIAQDLLLCKWIKVSINAGDPVTYSEIHRTRLDDYGRVLSNMKTLSRLREINGANCTLGAQMVLLPENTKSVFSLASDVRDAGFDYLVIKPYSQHLSSNVKRDIIYTNIGLAEDLKAYESDKFKIIYRVHVTSQMFTQCYATPYFWAYIDSLGNVWGCSCYFGKDERFCYGNINKKSFTDIWQSESRRNNLEFIRTSLNISDCRLNCRMDKCNRYLNELMHPNDHVNFI